MPLARWRQSSRGVAGAESPSARFVRIMFCLSQVTTWTGLIMLLYKNIGEDQTAAVPLVIIPLAAGLVVVFWLPNKRLELPERARRLIREDEETAAQANESNATEAPDNASGQSVSRISATQVGSEAGTTAETGAIAENGTMTDGGTIERVSEGEGWLTGEREGRELTDVGERDQQTTGSGDVIVDLHDPSPIEELSTAVSEGRNHGESGSESATDGRNSDSSRLTCCFGFHRPRLTSFGRTRRVSSELDFVQELCVNVAALIACLGNSILLIVYATQREKAGGLIPVILYTIAAVSLILAVYTFVLVQDVAIEMYRLRDRLSALENTEDETPFQLEDPRAVARWNRIETVCPVTKAESEEGGDEEDPPTCAICLESIEKDTSIRRLPCRHFYHAKCIETWLFRRFRCPSCNCAVGSQPPDVGTQPAEALEQTHQTDPVIQQSDPVTLQADRVAQQANPVIQQTDPVTQQSSFTIQEANTVAI